MKKFRTGIMALAAVLLFVVYAGAADAPIIRANPQSRSWPAGSSAVWTCECDGDPEGLKYSYNWYLRYNGEVYDLTGADGTADWEADVGEVFGNNGNQFLIEGINPAIHDAQIWCEVFSETGKSVSTEASVIIGGMDMSLPASIVVPVSVEFDQGATATLSCYAEADGPISFVWYTSPNGSIAKITSITAEGAGTKAVLIDTATPLSTYYICAVTVGDNTSFSSPVKVTVHEADVPTELEIMETPTQLTYAVGDKPNLEGLKVRLRTSMGEYIELEDASGISVSPELFTKSGKQIVTIEKDGLEARFVVTVSENAAIITEQPADTAVEMYETAVFHCKADNAVSWQWYILRSGGDSSISYPEEALSDGDYGIIGVHTDELTVPAGEELDNCKFYCFVYNRDGEAVRSETARLTITLPAEEPDDVMIDEPAEEEPEQEPELPPAVTEPASSHSLGISAWKLIVPIFLLALCIAGAILLICREHDERDREG